MLCLESEALRIPGRSVESIISVRPGPVGLLRSAPASPSLGTAESLVPPTAVRARFFKYRFTEPGATDWWQRTPLKGDVPQLYLPPKAE